jgi:hypothetical protein
MRYPWVVDKTYKFIIKRETTVKLNMSCSFTLFYNGNEGEWIFFAAWSRPKLNADYMGYSYSFLENFGGWGWYPYTWNGGAVSRTANLGNMWFRDDNGTWVPITNGTFSMDDAGLSRFRVDSSGGIFDSTTWWLQMGGFGDAYTKPWTRFDLPSRPSTPPPVDESAIDFNELWKKVVA